MDMLAYAADESSIQLQEFPSGRKLAELRPLNPGIFRDLQFSPDGKRLALATENQDVFVWHLPKMRAELRALGLDW